MPRVAANENTQSDCSAHRFKASHRDYFDKFRGNHVRWMRWKFGSSFATTTDLPWVQHCIYQIVPGGMVGLILADDKHVPQPIRRER